MSGDRVSGGVLSYNQVCGREGEKTEGVFVQFVCEPDRNWREGGLIM
jgi:capsid protein